MRITLACLLAVGLCVSVALALDRPLSDEAVREAYFLGQRHDETTAQFLETYRRYFPIPESGPHVYAVEFFTPYAQAVEAASKRAGNYSAQQAKEDYLLRGDSVRVGVHIRYTSTYGPGAAPSTSKTTELTGRRGEFQVRLIQRGTAVEAKNVKHEGTWMSVGGGKGGGGSRATGFIVWQEYDASNLTSDEATVEIDTPDGQHVVASFDLSRLR